ncbi:MAG: ABC transporter substrate-binding protein [Rhodospirillales bacterium]|nr:ABC transporter substrate-binding protein [Rhodospirillales bacterium]MBO6787773.1 ABC transporter substrate-binding protein [Rhodospirillales bacterium]
MLIGSTPTGHLMWIAEDQAFFRAHDVDVKLLEFSSGVSASRALNAGEIHLGNSSEFAFVTNLLDNHGLKLVASIARANSANLFARRDRGIAHVADLPGRKIAVTRGSIGEFFLGEILAINGLTPQDVTLVNLRPPEIVGEIANGTVDAAIIWEPFVFKAKAALGDNFLLLPEQDSYYYHFVLAGNGSWIDTHRTEVRAVLRALLDAQRFAAEHPHEAQEIIARRFRLDLDFVRDTWSKYVLEVTLLQNLISLMEQETQWLIDNGHLSGASIPDYLSVIDPQPLSFVEPEAVKLIE